MRGRTSHFRAPPTFTAAYFPHWAYSLRISLKGAGVHSTIIFTCVVIRAQSFAQVSNKYYLIMD